MSSSVGGLAPWQKVNAYYKGLQINEDISNLTQALSNQTKAMIASQASSASSIVISQERIEGGIDNLVYAMNDVKEGIFGLKAAFEWGISEVVWQIEQNREILRGILEVLSAPLNTQAKELRKRAEKAYKNGWIDEALEEFMEAEKKNKYDFAIHISLGHIYFFHKNDKIRALEYYEKAVKFAKPDSKYHASYALIHKALIQYSNGLIAEAERSSNEAVELTPDFAEAIYQNAQYNAQMMNVQQSIINLEKAILLDANYAIKVTNDMMFDKIRKDVDKLLLHLRDKEICLCNNLLDKLDKSFNQINQAMQKTGFHYNVNFEKSIYNRKKCIHRNSFIDALLTTKSLKELGIELMKCSEEFKVFINKSISKIDDKINMVIRKNEKEIKEDSETNTKLFCWFLVLPLLLSSVFGGCIAIQYYFRYSNNIGLVVISLLIWWFVFIPLGVYAAKKIKNWLLKIFYKPNEMPNEVIELQSKKEEYNNILHILNREHITINQIIGSNLAGDFSFYETC